jgi:hypothetical protein
MASKLVFAQGDTPLISVPIKVNSVVEDLTGYTAFFTLTDDPSPNSDNSANVQLSVTLDSTAIANFQLTEALTSPLEPVTAYNWDVKLKDPTGAYFATIVNGTASINQSFTRRTS